MTDYSDLLHQANQAYDVADYTAALDLAQAAYLAAPGALERAESCEIQMRVYHARGLYDQVLGVWQIVSMLLTEAEANNVPLVDRLRVEERAFNTLGASQRQSGDLSSALETRYRQLEMGQRLDDRAAQSEALNGIAAIHASVGEYARAITHQEQAIALQRDRDDPRHLCRMLTNLADMYLHTGQLDAALHMAQEAWVNMQRIDINADPQVMTRVLFILAVSYSQQNLFSDAQDAFEDALRLAELYEVPRAWIDACSRYADFLIQRRQYGRALTLLRQGLQVGSALGGHTPWIYDIYRQIAIVHEAMGDYQAALVAFREYHRLEALIFNTDSDARLRQMEVQFRTEVAEREAEFFRRQAEAAQMQQEQDRQYFERLTKLKDELLATASHDLKNPIAAIRTSAALLRRHIDARFYDHLDHIDRQVARINHLITGILELAKLETGRALNARDESLARLVDDCVSMFRSQADDHRITLTTDLPDVPIIVHMDAMLIARVLDNLISNALKYTSAGGSVRVGVALMGEQVQVSVSDTGIGIPDSEIDRVFERFYRVKQDHRHEVEGTGLGLAIARSIVEQHGGQIGVFSVPGQGSTFYFTLPLGI